MTDQAKDDEPEWKTRGWAFDPGDKRVVETPCRAKIPGKSESICEGRQAVVSGGRRAGSASHIAQFRCLKCGQGWTLGY